MAAADHAGLGVGEQHHRAVGAAHHQRDAGLVGDDAVGDGVEVAVDVGARTLRADVRDVVAVHLAEDGDGVAGREVVSSRRWFSASASASSPAQARLSESNGAPLTPPCRSVKASSTGPWRQSR